MPVLRFFESNQIFNGTNGFGKDRRRFFITALLSAGQAAAVYQQQIIW